MTTENRSHSGTTGSANHCIWELLVPAAGTTGSFDKPLTSDIAKSLYDSVLYATTGARNHAR